MVSGLCPWVCVGVGGGTVVGEQRKVAVSYRHPRSMVHPVGSALASVQTFRRHRWPCQLYTQPGSDQQSYHPAIRQHAPSPPGTACVTVVDVASDVASDVNRDGAVAAVAKEPPPPLLSPL